MTYSFVFMSICVFQNMNLVIVEDSYLNVKYKHSYNWLVDGEEENNGDAQGALPGPNQGKPPGGDDDPYSGPRGPKPDLPMMPLDPMTQF